MPPRTISLPFSAKALREARERAGLTLTDLARRCQESGYSVHSTTLGKIEREVNKPSPPLLRALTSALNVKLDDLLDDQDSAA